MDNISKSLEVILKANLNGDIDDLFLIKAVEKYRKKKGWKPSKKYILAKSKTFNDFINGKDVDEELMKALTLGDTKVKNGVTYVVKKTPSGKLDWRVANKQTSQKVDDGFPTDMTNLEYVKNLGGSTGAKLVKDKDTGKLYVMKRGASKEHAEEEYLSNKIYKELGVTVPDVKLEQYGKETVMLSKFMSNTEVANNILDDRLKDEITKNFVADCLMANWDIYLNDNILINKDDGQIYRVDNGGSLRFSATGRDKGDEFGDEVEELDTMIAKNLSMTQNLSTADIDKQIANILPKEKAVLSLIKDKDLRIKMKKRFFDLKSRLGSDYTVDANHEFTEKELSKILKKTGHLLATDTKVGWKFLSEVAKKRGFDGVPEVLDAKEFDKLIKSDDVKLLHRGLTGNRGTTAQSFMKQFTEGEDCFYGTVGMYGAGIYAAVNATKKLPPPPNHDYDIAMQYSNYKPQNILHIAVKKDTKIIDSKKLDDMMEEEFFGTEYKEKKAEYDDIRREIFELEDKINNVSDTIEKDTKSELNWNEKALKSLNDRPEEKIADPEIHSFEKAGKYFGAIVNKVGGKIEKLNKDNYKITLPLSDKEFIFNSFIAKRSLKQKNEHTKPYNFHYRNLRDFIIDEHYGKINEEITKRQAEDTDSVKNLQKEIKDKQKVVNDISKEINSLKQNGNSSIMGTVLAEVAKRPHGEYRGIYAAIKGYDMIIQKNGWGGETDFAIILNRSKLVVKKH